MEGQEKEPSKKKKILEKSLLSMIIILVLLAFFIVMNRSGWRMDWSIRKINYLKYSHLGPDFSFRYPDYFRFDSDAEKRFGTDYVAGFKLATDQKTGCDVRYNPFSLNFQKSDKEIQDAIQNDLAKNAKDFTLIAGRRMKIGGEDAFLVEFNFLDPTGSMARLSQVMTSHAGSGYVIVCGTGDYQYKYFQRDFNDFFDNFQWKK